MSSPGGRGGKKDFLHLCAQKHATKNVEAVFALSSGSILEHTLCSILLYAAAGRKIPHSGIYSVLVVSL